MRIEKIPKITYKTLKNGLKVVLEDVKAFRSVSIGLGILGGSSSDPKGLEGMAHLIEHMVFKGSKKRSSYQIKEPIEKSGGTLNGFTSREITFYYTKVPDFKALEAIDILFDMVLDPLFDGEDLKREKGVIIEEIKELNDDPYGKVHDIFLKEAFNNSTYGSAIFGSESSVLRISKPDIMCYHEKFYNTSNMILSVCGKLSEKLIEKIYELENKYHSTDFLFEINSPRFSPRKKEIIEFKSDINQVHLLLGTLAPGRKEDDFFAFSVLNTLLGDGMSSRLFNKIREEAGLAYNIHTEYITFGSSGLFLIYSSTSPDKCEALLDKIQKEIEAIGKGLISHKESEYGKERIKGELLLANESTFSRMYKNFDEFRVFNKVFDIDQLLSKFDKVTIDNLVEISRKYFQNDWLIVQLRPKY